MEALVAADPEKQETAIEMIALLRKFIRVLLSYDRRSVEKEKW